MRETAANALDANLQPVDPSRVAKKALLGALGLINKCTSESWYVRLVASPEITQGLCRSGRGLTRMAYRTGSSAAARKARRCYR